MSPCLKTAVVHLLIALASRIESMIDAWLSASETMKSPSCATVPVSPSFAFHADTKLSDDSQPTNLAHAASSSRWIVNVPQMKRTLAVPAPSFLRPSIPACTTAGSSHSPR